MADQEGKRCRGSPFTQDEKDVLKEVVVQKATIIENKKTDAFSAKEKKNAWVWVASTFNSYPNVTRRTYGQLKKAWDNMKTRRKKLQAAATQHKLATGGAPPLPELDEDPLMELAVPHLLHAVSTSYDSDAIAMRASSATGHCPASPSFRQLTGTPILEEDLDGSDDDSSMTSHPPSPSGLREEMTDLTTEVEEEPTSQSRPFLNLGGRDESFPHSSCARLETIFESSRSGMASSFGSSRRTPTEERPRSKPSSTAVRPPSTDSSRSTPTDRTWLGEERPRSVVGYRGSHIDSTVLVRDRPRSNPNSTAHHVPSTDSARKSPVVCMMATATTPTTSAASSCSASAGRRVGSFGEGGERSLPRPVLSVRRTSRAAEQTAVCEGDEPANAPYPSTTTKSRLAFVREEHEERMSQLQSMATQKEELNDIRLREARADARAAESRARAEEARAQRLEGELAFERWRWSRAGFGGDGAPQP